MLTNAKWKNAKRSNKLSQFTELLVILASSKSFAISTSIIEYCPRIWYWHRVMIGSEKCQNHECPKNMETF